jgi:hypothetical protein
MTRQAKRIALNEFVAIFISGISIRHPPRLIYFSHDLTLDFIAVTVVGDTGLYVWMDLTKIGSNLLIFSPFNAFEALFSVNACIAFNFNPDSAECSRTIAVHSTLYLRRMNVVKCYADLSANNHASLPIPFDNLKRLGGLISAPRDFTLRGSKPGSAECLDIFCTVSQYGFIFSYFSSSSLLSSVCHRELTPDLSQWNHPLFSLTLISY